MGTGSISFPLRIEKGDVYITGMLQSRDNGLLRSTTIGLFIMDPGQGKQRYYNLDFNLQFEQPTILFEDKDGSICLANGRMHDGNRAYKYE